jgi:NADH-quinone oxidoreductase subunit E
MDKASMKEQLAEIIEKVNVERGSAIPILQAVQNKLGYVSKEMIDEISAQTGIPASDLFGITTFYSQFYMEPRGEHVCKVCHGTACHLAGADRITAAVEMATGAKEGHTSADGKFSHERVACLGCCSLAPVVMVDDEVHANVKTDKVAALLRKYTRPAKDAEGTTRAGSQPVAE